MEPAKPPSGANKASAKRKSSAKKGGPPSKKPSSGGAKVSTPPKGSGAARTDRVEAAAAIKVVDFKGQFTRDLQPMLYGFGDAPVPLKETVALVEDIVIDYVGTMAHQASDLSGPHSKVTEHELLHLVRKDARKYSRARELIQMSAVLAESKRLLDDKDSLQAAADAGGEEGDRQQEEGD